jgi:hypothetical protein
VQKGERLRSEENDALEARIQKEIDDSPEVRAWLEGVRKQSASIRKLLDNPTTLAAKQFEADRKKMAELIAHGRTLLRQLKACENLNLDDDRDFLPAFYRAARCLGFSDGEFNNLHLSKLFPLLEAWLKAKQGLNPYGKFSPWMRKRLKISGGRRKGTRVDGRKLREFRKSIVVPGGQPTTQQGLAEICGVSTDTIQRGEKGRTWSDDVFEDVAAGITVSLQRTIKPQDLRKK